MGSSKRNLLTSILLLVVMGIFAVLTIFIVVDAINKKYYNDIKVEYEVQEESPNIILTFARNEGSNFSTDNTKVMLNEDKTKFRIDGTVPEIQNGVVTNLDDLTSSDGREFYFFSINSSFIDPQEDPENPDFIFSETDSRYYVSTEDNPIWYDVPKSSENLTLYSVFLTPNVHNSDFANAPLLSTSPNVIISHDVVDIPYNAFSDIMAYGQSQGQTGVAKIESVVIPNSIKSINSKFDMMSGILGGAFAGCATLTNIVIPSSVEYVGGEAFMLCSGLDTVKYGNGYYLPTENNEHAILINTNLKAENVTIHEACISIQGNTFSKYFSIMLGLIPPPDMGDGSNEEEIMSNYINLNLQEITIPKNVKNIGMGAFMMCMGLENVEFKANSDLTNIGVYSFTFCSILKTINLEDTKLEEIGMVAFASMDESMPMLIEEITLPSTLKAIGESAFMYCGSLKTVNFEDNSQLTSIGEGAFTGCSSLNKINIQIESIESYLENLPKEVDMKDPTTYPITMQIMFGLESSSLNKLPSISLNQNGQEVTNIEIPGTMTEIPMYAFAGLNIKSVNIPSGVTSIGEGAFFGCSSLSKINIQIESIESYLENLQEFNPDDPTTYPIIMQIIMGLQSSDLSRIPNISLNQNGQDITDIEIPDNTTEIPMGAFAYLNIKSVNIPSSVTSIGEGAFSYCSSLTSITIPEGVTSIGGGAFAGCSSLTSITIPENVTSIGSSAFSNCTSLETVTFDGNSQLSSIGNSAFQSCSITSIEIPNSVINIGESAFYLCDKLKSVIFEEQSQLEIIDSMVFEYCDSLISITIPESVTSIGSGAFRHCSSLISIKIPEGVTSIGSEAFRYCNKLIEVYDLTGSDGLKITKGSTSNGYVGYYADYIYTSLDTPLKQQIVGDYIFFYDNDTMYLSAYLGTNTDLTLPSIEDVQEFFTDVTFDHYKIKEYAFSENHKITSVVVPNCVTSIGSYAFSDCSSLTSITIPDSVTSIGDSAFESCSSLTSITIPDSVTRINSYAFRDCTGLTSIIFEDMTGLTSIGSFIFDGCDNVIELIIQSGEVKDLGFSDLSNLTTVTLGDGVTSIGRSAFNGCLNLTSIKIPESVTVIENYAFSDCSSLTSITIPDSVTSIGDYAFRDCRSLTSITIPDSVTSIGEQAFYNCSSLKTVTFGENSQFTSIESSAFYNCTSLTSITIPDSVTSIGDQAFNGCSSLTSITIPDRVTSIGRFAFYGCRNLTSIRIPKSVTSIGDYAFDFCYKLVEVYDLTGSDGLNITVGSSDNGYVGCYADFVYTDINTPLVQKAVNNDYIFYYNNGVMYLLGYTGSDKELKLPSIDEVKKIFTDFSGDTYEIYEYAFYENTNITSVVIPNCVTSIGDNAFYNCRSLTSITIPDSVTSIGSYAFYDCSSLTSITIPDSVTSIGSGAFRACWKITIYCEAESQPTGWSSDWNSSNRTVYWGGEWEMVEGVPVSIESGVEGVGYSDIGEDFGIGFDGLGFREEIYFNDKRERNVV